MIGAALAAVLAQASPVWAALPEGDRAALSACEVGPAELEDYLSLGQHAFDQDLDGGGWRGLSYEEGCEPAAAALIQAYILYSRPMPPDSHTILRWHAGQVLAGLGRTDEALAYFGGTYHAEDESHGSAWNRYADATIAFLEDDYDALIEARDALALLKPSAEEVAERREWYESNPDTAAKFRDWEEKITQPQNMHVVESLIACFGRPYSEAYGTCEMEGTE